MAYEEAISLLCTITGYSPSQVSGSDDAQSLELWDSVTHVNVILALEETLGRPLATSEIIDVGTVIGIQTLLDAAKDKRGAS